MIRNILAVAANTFTEAIRQPVYVVIIFATTMLFMLSPSLVMFALREEDQLLSDIGLSNLLVAGLFIAIFAASTVVTDEIDRKTALTVISKSVSRHSFVIGKFLGIVSAVILAQYLLSLVYMFTVRHGVLVNASDHEDLTTVVFGCLSIFLACLIGAFCNYFYKWRFASTTVLTGTILATISFLLLFFIDDRWRFSPSLNNFPIYLFGPVSLIVLASILFSAIAVAAAIRFNMVTTMIVSTLTFVLGTMVHYKLGPVVSNPQGTLQYIFAWLGLAFVPSINLYIVTDVVYESKALPMAYFLKCLIYTTLYSTGALTVAIFLFRKRDIG